MSTVDCFRTFFQQSFWHRPVRLHAERPVCSLRAHKDRQYSLRIRDLLFRIRDPLAAKVPRYGDLHIAVIMVVGLWAAKKVKNSEDWFVGGRSMGPWITALAHGSSSLGGVYQLTWIAWSVLSPAFIPCIIGGLYWKNATKGGAIAAMLVGSVTGFGWYYLLQEITNIHTFFAALVLATAAYIIVSKLTKKPPQEVLDLFYYAKSFDPADADSEAISPAKAVAESSDGTKPSTVSAGIQMSADQFRAVLENA